MIPAAPLRVCRADFPGNDVLLITAPRFMQPAIFVTGYGAWITIKNVGHEKPPGRKTLPSSLVYPAVRVVNPAQIFERNREFELDILKVYGVCIHSTVNAADHYY
jgi:hypothetical protein